MLTIEEKIRQLEAIAESGDELYADYEEHGLQDTHGARRTKSLIEEKRQEIEWLRELQERRKAPEIIRCKDCKHYEWMSNRIPEEQTWHCHCWDADTGKDDFCSYAERRSE